MKIIRYIGLLSGFFGSMLLTNYYGFVKDNEIMAFLSTLVGICYMVLVITFNWEEA